jgi:hypothetical protein
MKPGDLVQHTIFDRSGSGGYGLVLSKSKVTQAGFWDISWAGYKDEFTGISGGTYEVHEEDLVIVTEASK